jgi:hypothetical protein
LVDETHANQMELIVIGRDTEFDAGSSSSPVAARSLPAVLAAPAATEQFIPVDATTEDTEGFMVGGLSFEAFASNLRVLDMGPAEAVRPVAIWGPAILVQIDGELASGICTLNGHFRIVSDSHGYRRRWYTTTPLRHGRHVGCGPNHPGRVRISSFAILAGTPNDVRTTGVRW